MTLDEAIKHAEEVSEENERLCEQIHPALQWKDYGKCASEHRQLAEWLRDYKRLKEQEPCEDAISRQAVIDEIYKSRKNFNNEFDQGFFADKVIALPPVNPQPKTGHWIWCVGAHKCSSCEGYACFSDKKMPRYCPNCGAKMVEPQESDHKCHKCHTCKHYTSGEHDGSCGSYICKEYSNWESEDSDADSY